MACDMWRLNRHRDIEKERIRSRKGEREIYTERERDRARAIERAAETLFATEEDTHTKHRKRARDRELACDVERHIQRKAHPETERQRDM